MNIYNQSTNHFLNIIHKNNAKVSRLFFIVTILLLWSDFFNWLFGFVFLVAWKQLIVVLFWILAFSWERNNNYRVITVLLLMAHLFFAFLAIFNEQDVVFTIFNAILIMLWYPVWRVFVNKPELLLSLTGRKKYLFFVLIISAVGMVLDANTGIFDFLPKLGATHEYFVLHEEVKRAAFFFVTSTMIIPLIGTIAVLFFIKNNQSSSLVKYIGIFSIMIIAVSAGSSSTFVTGSILSMALLMNTSFRRDSKAKGKFIVLLFIPIGVFFLSYLINDSETVSRNFERSITNLFEETDSNYGRNLSREMASNSIANFTVMEHFFGAGLGSTNSRFGFLAKYTHGESSYYQTYIEIGLIGVILRIAPFVMIFRIWMTREKTFDTAIVLIMGCIIFLSVITAPTYGNVPVQYFLAILLSIIQLTRPPSRKLNLGAARSAWF